MMLGTEGNLQSLTGGLLVKVRIQHPGVHERTDRGGSYWYFRYWEDVLQPDGTTKPVRRFHFVGASKGDNRITKKQAEVERDKIGEKWCVRPERILTEEETVKVLARLSDPNLLVLETAIATGARISEILGLKWCYVDLQSGVLRIVQRYWRGDIDDPKSKTS